ncbi:MAG: type II secretion system protein [Minisyncoccia bacterium]|jgi:prepilin-type N-terminal cleavage/methylation domain-containing protein
MKHRTRGFTLIELLVVIAIIGILASIVLVSLNAARNKGKDARVIADVQQARVALETGYNGAYYPDLNTVGNAVCANAGTLASATWANCGNSTGPDSTSIATVNTDASGQGGGLFFTLGGPSNGNISSYAIRGQLVSSSTVYFCIDSSGRTNAADTNVALNTCH